MLKHETDVRFCHRSSSARSKFTRLWRCSVFPIKAASARNQSKWEHCFSHQLAQHIKINLEYFSFIIFFNRGTCEFILFIGSFSTFSPIFFRHFYGEITQNTRTCAWGSFSVKFGTLVCNMKCTSSDLILWTLCKCVLMIGIATE